MPLLFDLASSFFVYYDPKTSSSNGMDNGMGRDGRVGNGMDTFLTHPILLKWVV